MQFKVEYMQPIGDNIIPFPGMESVTTFPLLGADHGDVTETDGEEQPCDRVHAITVKLRSWDWSEDSILAAKVAVIMGFILALACVGDIVLDTLSALG